MLKFINRVIVFFMRFIPRPVLFLFARRYVAGSRLEDAVRVVKELNRRGIRATMDLLGESVKRKEQSREAVEEYKRMVDTIHREGLDSGISIKLTQYGLNIDEEFCYSNVKEIVSYAAERGVFVRIDMEDSSTIDATLRIYKRLRDEGFDNVGIVLQAMIRRAVRDLLSLAEYSPSVRVCKGIYVEPPEVAFQDPWVIHRNFGHLCEEVVRAGGFLAIATHNQRMIWEGLRVVEHYRLPKDRYEFQMLYGVKTKLRDILLSQGHPVRIYVPYGRDWKPYTLRRFKENPALVGYVIKALFTGGK